MKFLKRLMLGIVVMILIASTMVSAQGSGKSSVVSEKIVKQVAQDFLQRAPFSSWKEGTVRFESHLYDLNDQVIGYYFSVQQNNEGLGYVLVSSSKDLPPILQFGDRGINYNVDQNIKNGNRFYYLGAFQYQFGKNSNEVKDKFLKAKQSALHKLENEGLQNSEQFIKVVNSELRDLSKNSAYQKSWEKALISKGEDQQISTQGTVSQGTVLNVTRVWQRQSGVNSPNSSCAPATGTMITNYFGSQGYDVRTSSYYGGDASLINHLYYDMNTAAWGTSAGGFSTGLQTHLNHDLYPSAPWNSFTQAASGNWSNYESQINKSRPVGLRFDSNNDPWAYGDYHFVAGNAYYIDQEDAFAGCKDPDGGEYNTGTNYFSWGINEPYMTMIFTYNGTF